MYINFTFTYLVFTESTFAAQFVSFPVAWAQPHLGHITKGEEQEGIHVLAAGGTKGVDTNDDDDDDWGQDDVGGCGQESVPSKETEITSRGSQEKKIKEQCCC